MGASESTLSFQRCVFRLYEDQDLSLEDEEYWNGLFNSTKDAEQVFSLTTPFDIRKILKECPQNMEKLITKSVSAMLKCTGDGNLKLNQSKYCEFMTCARILTRVLPFVYEDKSKNWIEEYFSKTGPEDTRTNAERLIDVSLYSLFLPGLTLPEDVTPRKEGFCIIWEAGIACSSAPVSTYEIDNNRTELLRLFLTIHSQILYGQQAAHFRTHGVYFTNMLLSRIPKHTSMALLGSLLNVIVQYNLSGLGLPYDYLMFTDARESLAPLCIQCLVMLLDFKYPFERTQPSPPSPREEKKQSSNLFQDYFSRIHKVEDLEFILSGLKRLLNNPLSAVNSMLPGSYRQINFQQELIIFTWKSLEINKRLLAHLLQDANLFDIILPILVYAIQSRKNESSQGLVNVCCFLFLLLSGERNFGVRLNKQYPQNYPQLELPVFEGNYADVLILSIYKLITDCDRGRLFILFDCMLTTISNISPYIKSISSMTSQKLLSLFKIFTKPKFLLANPTNHNLCATLLDVFNNMIQYQFDGNTRLIYSILRQKELFEDLEKFNLEDALEKISKKSDDSEDSGLKHTPTEDWVNSWKKALPLNIVLKLLQILSPQVDRICEENGNVSEEAILRYLSSGTLVGLLPVPHALMVRKYKPNEGTFAWSTIYMWGVFYLASINPPIWMGTQIDLFMIKQS